jgi:hypothetical protein
MIPVSDQGGGATALKEAKDAYDKQREWEDKHPPPTLQVSIHPNYAKAIVEGYKKDPLLAQTQVGGQNLRSTLMVHG